MLAGHAAGDSGQTIVTRHTVREMRADGAHVLLVEDNITNQQVALSILKKLGVQVEVVASGQEALDLLEKTDYDLVFMDVQMPGMDGLETTQAIRSRSVGARNDRIPVVAMTAHALQGDRERCLAAGMDDYVAKPVTPQSLAAVLGKWLPSPVSHVQIPHSGGGQLIQNEAGLSVTLTVFDRQAFAHRMMGDIQLAREIMECFLESVPQQIQGLAECLRDEDNVAAERQAHTLKGASASVGGEALRAVAGAIENALHSGDRHRALDLLPELEEQYVRFKEAATFDGWQA